MVTEEDRELLKAALLAQKQAHCPFSRYPVGSAVRTQDGTIVTGCNVESASFSLTCCAERVAVFKAVSEGHKRITACSIVTLEGKPAPPCGACRQVLAEFAKQLPIVLVDTEQNNATREVDLETLLPDPFSS
jgi:cytidine deaminase